MNKKQRPIGPGAPGPAPQPEAPHEPAPVDLAEESIAGEEDPGASLDLAVGSPAPSPQPGEGARDTAPANGSTESSASRK